MTEGHANVSQIPLNQRTKHKPITQMPNKNKAYMKNDTVARFSCSAASCMSAGFSKLYFSYFLFFFYLFIYLFFFFAAVILVAVLFLLATSCWRVSVKTMFQEEPPDVLYKKSLRACNFVKKRLQHRCFPVNYAKFLRNICERLLLHYEHLSSYSYVFKLKLTEIVLVGYTSQIMIENDIFKWKILRKI